MSTSVTGPYIGGKQRSSKATTTIKSPYDGAVVGEVGLGDASDLESAISGAAAAFKDWSRSATHTRAVVLEKLSQLIAAEQGALATLITRESGKPIRYAKGEVARAISTFRLGAAEAQTLGGEVLPSDQLAGAEGRLTLYRRVARGPVAGISPFNFPLNLVAHKLAPALAVGAPLVLKPAPQAPLTAHRLAELATAAGAPAHAFDVVHTLPEVAERLATDARLPVLSFTGSDAVGWHLEQVAQRKHVLLELGGNAPCLIDETVDLEALLPRVVDASFANAGQVCIKAQRLFVVRERYDAFVERFVALTKALVVGDPLDEKTVVGPMIEARHVERVLDWVKEATSGGAKLLCGGKRDGNVLEPTVLTGTKPEQRVCKDEIFGPVTVIEAVDDFVAGLRACNASRFGIQASVFTRDLGRALMAYRELDFPGVLINDAPSFRVDNIPYGGVRDSGTGREGVKFAVEEFTETKLLSLRDLG
ncbi:MAG TPA: aldehyde dehydrogenase family protein [Polyangiaceae bacterium]|nr:aldehyde dehydrogenase family protein [Polyangiaceae bacterium]